MINLTQEERWMLYSLKEAEKALKIEEVPIGAILVKNDKIIGRGFNQIESLNDSTAHAEIIAITSASNSIGDWRLNDCSMFVTKEPCAMCAGAILNSRLKMIVFGCYDNDAGCCGSIYNLCGDPILNNTIIVKGGILKDTCRDILNAFFLEKRN